MAVTLKVNGIENLINDLGKLNKVLANGVGDEIAASAINIEKNAKRLAPVNLGTLRRSIHTKRISKLTYKVEATASYAPYIEFGTGGKVSIPTGYESYAMSFKGVKKGSYYDFLMALVEWIKKKGIKAGVYSVKTRRRLGNKTTKFNEDVAMAERIAYSILKKGIRAQPFLIPAFQQEIPQLFIRLKKILNVKS
jgi:HK97 gp10 family phage protein